MSTQTNPVERNYEPLRQSAGGLRLMRCRCTAGPGEPVLDEQHGACSITLLERGTLSYRTVAGKARLTPGWLMLGNPGDGYACSHEDSDGRGDDCIFFSMPAPTLDAALEALAIPGATTRFRHAALPPLPRVSALLANLLRDGDEGFALDEGALAVVETVQSAIAHQDAPAAGERHDERARHAAHCIETRATEPLTIADVARSVGVSGFHLMRSFKQALGVTPHQYLMRIRLLRALEMLRDTATPVTSVAYECGWADLSNFQRTFRRDVGCTPGDFRRGKRTLLQGDARA